MLKNGLTHVKKVQRFLKILSMILLIGFPKFTRLKIKIIKSPTTQPLWQISFDFFFCPHEHFTDIQVILTPVLPNFLSMQRKIFIKSNLSIDLKMLNSTLNLPPRFQFLRQIVSPFLLVSV